MEQNHTREYSAVWLTQLRNIMSGIGLIGSSGCGKTTLAVKISEAAGIPFIGSQARGIHTLLGIDPDKPCDYDLKMKAQTKMLEVAESEYESVNGLFISDRTPMDFAAHMMAESLSHNLNEEQTQFDLDYVEDCYRVTNLYFSCLILIPPAKSIAIESGRANNKAYANHIQTIMTGMIADPYRKLYCGKHFMKQNESSLMKRAEMVVKVAALGELNCITEKANSVTH